MRHGKAQLEDPLGPMDVGRGMWTPLKGGSETRAARAVGSNTRFLRSSLRVPAHTS